MSDQVTFEIDPYLFVRPVRSAEYRRFFLEFNAEHHALEGVGRGPVQQDPDDLVGQLVQLEITAGRLEVDDTKGVIQEPYQLLLREEPPVVGSVYNVR